MYAYWEWILSLMKMCKQLVLNKFDWICSVFSHIYKIELNIIDVD